MSHQQTSKRLSTDTWAVLLAIAIAVAIRLGLVATIPW
jgi:hypothetical protein